MVNKEQPRVPCGVGTILHSNGTEKTLHTTQWAWLCTHTHGHAHTHRYNWENLSKLNGLCWCQHPGSGIKIVQNLTTGGNGQIAHKETPCVLFLTIACESIIISIKFSTKKAIASNFPWTLRGSASNSVILSVPFSHSCTKPTSLFHSYGPAQPCGLNHCQLSTYLLHCAGEEKLHPLKSLPPLTPSKKKTSIHKLVSLAHHVATSALCPKN